MRQKFTGYDIIGDIHGRVHTLACLLNRLGYVKRSGTYVYHDRRVPRQAIFLGDFIDRGPGIRQVVHIVRDMVHAGSAQAIMGNHEYNALLWAINNACINNDANQMSSSRGTACKPFIEATLAQYANYSTEWRDTLTWFYELPLFIEQAHFRAVHACWDQPLIDQLLKNHPHRTIDQTFLLASQQQGSLAYQIVDRLMRGISLQLPQGHTVKGADGIKRRRLRVKFWQPHPDTYADIAMQPDTLNAVLAGRALTVQEKALLAYYGPQRRLLFIGHYWLKGVPQPQTANIACLDYSAIAGGRLVAYRLDHELTLSKDKFVWVEGEQ